MNFVREANDRLAVRRAVWVDCQAVAEEGFRLIGDRILDLSTSNMLVRSDEAVRLYESVVVSLKCPNGISWIDAEAEVVRVVRGLRATDPLRAVGLRFTRMDAVDRGLLVGSLQELPPPIPARRLRRDYAGAVAEIQAFGPAIIAA